MAVRAFIFPGQGSQAVGMGRDLAAAFAAAREVFEEVDETLKQKLSKLMFEGPRRGADADRERPAGADGDVARRAARAGEARAASACATRRARGRRAFARRIQRPGRRRQLQHSPTRRGCCGCAARRCSRPCRPARARWPRCSACRDGPGARRSAPRPPRCPDTTTGAGRRWWSRPTTTAAARW